MRAERYVLAQLAQELAIGAAEGLGRVTRCDQHAEHALFHQQRRDHERVQPCPGEALRKRELQVAGIRLVDELAADAARQSVLIDRYPVRARPERGHCKSARCGARSPQRTGPQHLLRIRTGSRNRAA